MNAREHRRYVDMMALATYSALFYSRDPMAVLRSTFEDMMADQAKATELAISEIVPKESRRWYESTGREAIIQARPGFPVGIGTTSSYHISVRPGADEVEP